MEMKSIDPGNYLKFLAQQTIAQRPNLKNLSRVSNLRQNSTLKLYSVFRDLRRRSTETGFGRFSDAV